MRKVGDFSYDEFESFESYGVSDVRIDAGMGNTIDLAELMNHGFHYTRTVTEADNVRNLCIVIDTDRMGIWEDLISFFKGDGFMDEIVLLIRKYKRAETIKEILG